MPDTGMNTGEGYPVVSSDGLALFFADLDFPSLDLHGRPGTRAVKDFAVRTMTGEMVSPPLTAIRIPSPTPGSVRLAGSSPHATQGYRVPWLRHLPLTLWARGER